MTFGAATQGASAGTSLAVTPSASQAVSDKIAAGAKSLLDDWNAADRAADYDAFVVKYDQAILGYYSDADAAAAYWASSKSYQDLVNARAEFATWQALLAKNWKAGAPACELPEFASAADGVARLHTALALSGCMKASGVPWTSLAAEAQAYREWNVSFLKWRAENPNDGYLWTSGEVVDVLKAWEAELIAWRQRFQADTGQAPAAYQALPEPSKWGNLLGGTSDLVSTVAIAAVAVMGLKFLAGRRQAAGG